MKILISIAVAFSIVSCNKNKNSADKNSENQKQKIIFTSPLEFEYDPSLKKTDYLVTAGEHKFTYQQLFANEKSLKAMELRSQEMILAALYEIATDKLNETTETKNIQITLPKTDITIDMDKFFSRSGLEKNDKISIEHSPDAVQPGTAQIDETTYSVSELAKQKLNLAENQQRSFLLKMKRIEDRVSRAIIGAEAKKENLSLNQYLKQKLDDQNTVTKEEARQYGIKNNIPESSIDSDMLKRLQLIIQSKKQGNQLVTHAAQIFGGKKVSIAFKQPMLQINAPDSSIIAPRKGSGRLNLVLLSNFQCEECRQASEAVNSIYNDYSRDIEITYIFSFKKEDRISRMVAEAAMCIHASNQEKFWEFEEIATRESFDGSEEQINAALTEMNLDADEFRKCFLSRGSKDVVAAHENFTQNIGPVVTPSILINEQLIAGELTKDIMAQVVKEKLANLPNSLSMKNKSSLWSWFKGLFS